ncbi:MAG: hypothetical protein Fur0010_25030 [Bdellovibrio sp.]
MSYEVQKNIIEIQSLGRELKLHQEKIAENKKRIDFINSQRKFRQTKLSDDEQKLMIIKKEYAELEKSNQSTTEDRRLEILLEIDQLEIEIKEAHEFLVGSQETLNKIQKDVYYEDGYEMRDIDHLQMRVQTLKASLSPHDNDTLEYSLKSHPLWDFIKYIEGNRCSKCRFIIDTSSVQKIENGYLVEACPGCKSLLISTHAKS